MINNEFYKTLGEGWHNSKGDAVALLRHENKAKAPWVLDKLRRYHSPGAKVLDVGCGGGFLTLELAGHGYAVTGLDVTDEVLAPGRARDPEKKITWLTGNAEHLPLPASTFDAVCMMDVLEHLENPQKAVSEALRVLRKDGTFMFHTFNRTPLSWLFAAKGLDWFVPDSPKHIHSWSMFIKPREIAEWLSQAGHAVTELQGIHPRFASVLRLLATRRVPEDFTFQLGGNLQIGYLGCSRLK